MSHWHTSKQVLACADETAHARVEDQPGTIYRTKPSCQYNILYLNNVPSWAWVRDTSILTDDAKGSYDYLS